MAKIIKTLQEYWQAVGSFLPNARNFLLGSFLMNIGLSVFTLLFNLYLREAGYTEDLIGSVLSIGALGTFLMALPAAYIVRKYNSRSILIITTLLVSLGYLAQSFLLQPQALRITNLFVGAVLTISRLLSSPFFMRNSTEKERPHLFAFSMAVGVFAGILGNLLGGFLPNFFQSIQFARLPSLRYSLATGAILAVTGIFPFSLIRDTAPGQTETRRGRVDRQQRVIIAKLCIPYALVGGGAGFVIPFLNLYFREIFHATTAQIGTYFALLQGVMVIGFLLGPILTKRFGMVNTIVWTQLASIPFMFILALTNSISLAVIAFLIRGGLMNMSSPVQNLFNMERVSVENREITNSMTSLSWTGAWSISSYLGGIVIHQFSFNLSFYVTIGLYVASSLLYYFFFHGQG